MRAAHQKQTARQSFRSQSLAQCDIEARYTTDQLSESARDSRALPLTAAIAFQEAVFNSAVRLQ